MDEQPRPLLHTAMMGNAGFSALTGAVLTFAPSAAAGWLGVSIDGWLRLLGLALLGHAGVLLDVVRRADVRRWGWINLAAIAPYPLAMFMVVALGWVDRPLGVTLVLFDGLVVGALAAGHAMGLRAPTITRHTQPA